MLSIFGLAFDSTADIAAYPAIGGIGMVVIGAVLNRGKGLYEVDTKILSIDEQQIQIGSSVYPMSSISQLQFYYHSFYSQSSYGYFTEHSGFIEYGMHNTISFRHNKQEVSRRFYLANLEQANSYFALLAFLKERGVAYSSDVRVGRA